MKVKCIRKGTTSLEEGKIYEVTQTLDWCESSSNQTGIVVKDSKGYRLKDVMYSHYSYNANQFEVVEDVTVDDSVYELMNAIDVIAKYKDGFNAVTKSCGRIYKKPSIEVYVIMLDGLYDNFSSCRLVFDDNKWKIINTGNTIPQKLTTDTLEYVGFGTDVIKKIIATNPQKDAKLKEINDVIDKLKADLQKAEDKLKQIGG